MGKKTWKAIHYEDFDGPVLAPEIYGAIKAIRKAKKAIHDLTTSEDFYLEADDLLEEAIWKDVANVVSKLSGPEIPTTITLNKGSKKITVPLDAMHLASNFTKVDLPEELEWMLGTLAQCFNVRCKMLRQRLLWRPKDWWLRLVLADVAGGIESVYMTDGSDSE